MIGASGHYGRALKAIAESDLAFLSGVAFVHPEEPRDAVRRHAAYTESTKEYLSAEELLDQGELDVVIVNPPYGWNARWTIAAAERGIAIYSEKPLATTLEDLERLRSAVLQAGVPLVGMYEYRSDPVVYMAAKLVRSGRIGRPRLAFGQKSYKFGPERRPKWYADHTLYGGTIPWVAIHAIDWTRFIVGEEFVAVSAAQSPHGKSPLPRVDVAGTLQLESASGFCAAVTFDYLRPSGARTHGNDRFRIVGDDGELAGSVPERTLELTTDQGVEVVDLEEAPFLFERMLKALWGRDSLPMSAEDAIASTQVALWAREAADQRRRLDIPSLKRQTD